jgi:purine nucleoside permease
MARTTTGTGTERPLSPKVLLLPAFRSGSESDSPGEFRRWAEEFSFSERIPVPGAKRPVVYDPRAEVAAVITGVGNVEAVATLTAVLRSPRLDFSETYFLTAGTAGTPPRAGTLGSVFVNDWIVDWDQKYRLAATDGGDPADDESTPLEPFAFKARDQVCKRLNERFVSAARRIADGVDLADSAEAERYRERYPEATARSEPFVGVGTSVSGSEFWHGAACSAQARRLVETYDAGEYSTTEMEGFGTATVLERFGHLDRYLSLRSASNFDQPHPGQSAAESVHGNTVGLDVSVENVYRVGVAVVDRILENWAGWAQGVPGENRPA